MDHEYTQTRKRNQCKSFSQVATILSKKKNKDWTFIHHLDSSTNKYKVEEEEKNSSQGLKDQKDGSWLQSHRLKYFTVHKTTTIQQQRQLEKGQSSTLFCIILNVQNHFLSRIHKQHQLQYQLKIIDVLNHCLCKLTRWDLLKVK